MREIALSHPSTCEIRALRAVAEHGTVRAAARALYLSPHTVDAHLDHLRQKTGYHHIHQLIVWAATNDWFTNTYQPAEK
jgi:DNA-binding CsgD family transcriptional regulator